MNKEDKNNSIDDKNSVQEPNESRTYKFYFLLITFIFLFIILLVQFLTKYNYNIYNLKNIFTSINELNNYNYLKLNNKIKMIIINKPLEDEFSSFSFTIKIGTSNDPKEFNGLSHILEHLIFKKCKNYPYLNLNNILSKYYGNYNAHTLYNKTSFYFTIKNEGLKELTEVIIDCLKYPIFKTSDIKKELVNINSEIIMKDFSKKDYEIYKLFEWIVNPKSNLFNNGYKLNSIYNYQVLKKLKKELYIYHKQFYKANYMTIALMTNWNLSKVKNDFITNFEKIKNLKHKFENNYNEELFYKRDKNTVFYLKNMENNNYTQLSLNFDIIKDNKSFSTEIFKIFSLILKLDNENSLKNYWILNKKWIYELSDNIIGENNKHILYSINFKLTKNGEKNVENIVKYFKDFIFKLKNNSIKNLFSSISRISKLLFIFDNYKKKLSDSELILNISEQLQDYDYKSINYKNYIYMNFNEKLKYNFLNNFNFENCIFVINSHKFKTNESNIFYESSRSVWENIKPHLNNLKKQINKLNEVERKLINNIGSKKNDTIKINPFNLNFNYDVNYFLLDGVFYKQLAYDINFFKKSKKENFDFDIPDEISIKNFDSVIFSKNCSKDGIINYYETKIDNVSYNLNNILQQNNNLFLMYNIKIKKQNESLNKCLLKEFDKDKLGFNFKSLKKNNINFDYKFLNFITVPFIYVSFIIKSEHIINIIKKNKIEANLYMNLLCDYYTKSIKINFFKYSMVNSKFNCDMEDLNLKISFKGYSNYLFNFLKHSLDLILNFKFDENILFYVKQKLLYKIRQAHKMNNLESSIYYFETIFNKFNINFLNTKLRKDSIKIINKINANDMSKFSQNLFQKIKLNVLITGNILKTNKFEDFIIQKFNKFNLQYKIDKNLKQILNFDIKKNDHHLFRIHNNNNDMNNSYLSCFKIGSIPNKYKLYWVIFNKILNMDIFNIVKNKMNLSYIANSFIKRINYTYFNCILIEGLNFKPNLIEDLIDNIIKTTIKNLKKINQEEFTQISNNNINLLQPNQDIFDKIDNQFINKLNLREDRDFISFYNKMKFEPFYEFIDKFYNKNYKRITIEIFNKKLNKKEKNFKSKNHYKIENVNKILKY